MTNEKIKILEKMFNKQQNKYIKVKIYTAIRKLKIKKVKRSIFDLLVEEM